jgi:hypothetical protein
MSGIWNPAFSSSGLGNIVNNMPEWQMALPGQRPGIMHFSASYRNHLNTSIKIYNNNQSL